MTKLKTPSHFQPATGMSLIAAAEERYSKILTGLLLIGALVADISRSPPMPSPHFDDGAPIAAEHFREIGARMGKRTKAASNGGAGDGTRRPRRSRSRARR